MSAVDPTRFKARPDELVIAIDVGGTRVKYGLVALDGSVKETGAIDTLGPQGAGQMMQRLHDAIRPLLAQQPVGIAISTLGIIDPDNGEIHGAAEAIRDYQGQIIKLCFEPFGLPVTVENDVNCVALAEGWLGAGKDMNSFIALTLGTGIGGGIVIDKHLYRGYRQAAGEWGYMIIEGQIWEDVASLRGLATLASQQMPGETWTARRVFEASDNGNATAAQVIHRWYQYLATGLGNLIYAFNPEGVILGGGISGRGERFETELRSYLQTILRPDFFRMTPCVLASAGNHAGLLGATYNWAQVHRPA
ncbi:ROK family protein [Leeia oryzae]|uniref:ROK family protein n=1 Tax=Leeia oryzae TaxID=356662 RepID=UPI0003635E05|nr:ROK family protein [Leeia oryzae]